MGWKQAFGFGTFSLSAGSRVRGWPGNAATGTLLLAVAAVPYTIPTGTRALMSLKARLGCAQTIRIRCMAFSNYFFPFFFTFVRVCRSLVIPPTTRIKLNELPLLPLLARTKAPASLQQFFMPFLTVPCLCSQYVRASFESRV